MNHGKLNPPVQYCPNCGEHFKSDSSSHCSEEKHSARLKERNIYCYDCGKKLKK